VADKRNSKKGNIRFINPMAIMVIIRGKALVG